jgi:hypothetical protein
MLALVNRDMILEKVAQNLLKIHRPPPTASTYETLAARMAAPVICMVSLLPHLQISCCAIFVVIPASTFACDEICGGHDQDRPNIMPLSGASRQNSSFVRSTAHKSGSQRKKIQSFSKKIADRIYVTSRVALPACGKIAERSLKGNAIKILETLANLTLASCFFLRLE